MERNLDKANFVLMVCTETYRRRAMGLEEPGQGLGVDWEGNLIYNQIYHRTQNDQPRGSRFIPILLPGSEPRTSPTPSGGTAATGSRPSIIAPTRSSSACTAT